MDTYKELLNVFNITDVMDLPSAVNDLLFADRETRDAIYHRLIAIHKYDMSYDWFQRLYEQ